MNRYFQVQTDGTNPTRIIKITDSSARSRGADKGHHWFLLRTGFNENGPIGFHATDLSQGQQQRLEAFRKAAPASCELPADWNDYYATAEDQSARRWHGGAGAEVAVRRQDISMLAEPLAQYLKELADNAQ